MPMTASPLLPNETTGRLARPDGESLAWRQVEGQGPTVVWVGGWRSDMGGTKAAFLAETAVARGWSYLRFDHFAHGASSGDWAEATVGRWRDDLIGLLDDQVQGPVVLVGSSLGGWLAVLAALARPERVQALVLIAPATDFPQSLMWPGLDDGLRQAILRDGQAWVHDPVEGDYLLTRRFFDEARDWTLLEGAVALTAPVEILQGGADEPVPWRHALRLAEAIEGPDVVFTLIRDGDHRLSRPADLERLVEAVERARRA